MSPTFLSRLCWFAIGVLYTLRFPKEKAHFRLDPAASWWELTGSKPVRGCPSLRDGSDDAKRRLFSLEWVILSLSCPLLFSGVRRPLSPDKSKMGPLMDRSRWRGPLIKHLSFRSCSDPISCILRFVIKQLLTPVRTEKGLSHLNFKLVTLSPIWIGFFIATGRISSLPDRFFVAQVEIGFFLLSRPMGKNASPTFSGPRPKGLFWWAKGRKACSHLAFYHCSWSSIHRPFSFSFDHFDVFLVSTTF